MKRFIVRLLASIPAMCVSITTILMFAMSFDYPWLVLLLIGDFIGMMILFTHYEQTVAGLASYLKQMAEDAKEE